MLYPKFDMFRVGQFIPTRSYGQNTIEHEIHTLTKQLSNKNTVYF